MLFNSNDFLGFFAVFLALYYLLRHWLGARNLLIVIASYVFYGWWDYRFAGLLLLTSVLDFTLALGIDRSSSATQRRALLIASATLNLSVLFLFKYFDFFEESFAAMLGQFGVKSHWRGLHLILPVGVSFYTFQSLGYVIEVYRGQFPACRNLVRFLAFVSFFPHLIAGPIQRAATLLPQFSQRLVITRAQIEEGLWLLLWGMFKKVALADNFAPLVELVYQHPTTSGPMIALGTVAFALQIYCDFSGYSDIARGAARLLGIEIMFNFNLPYSATSLRDFWRRWNISLSSWLRDYLYVSLGGNRRGRYRTYLNLMLTMLLGGLWHGAAATFLLWGLWHGVGLAVNRWWQERDWRSRALPTGLAWGLTMLFALYGWLLFRADSLDQVLALTRALANPAMPAWWKPFLANLLVLATP
ncbi:MAG: MBOAT family protein, partial [Verrucomicrobia bacterium]|nr:MBOAT family protein [Verrucomicrobiota bacterium]